MCEVCSGVFKKKENLALHMRTHRQKEIKCHACPKVFRYHNIIILSNIARIYVPLRNNNI